MKFCHWKWIFTGVCLLLGILLLLKVRMILGPFCVGFAFAYLLNPLVEGLENHRVGRNCAIAIVFFFIIIIAAAAVFLIIPTLYNELSKLAVVLPNTLQSINDRIDSFREQFKATGLPNRVALVIDEHLGQGEGLLAGWLKTFLDNLPNAFASFSLYILSPIITIYFLVDWKKIGEGFFRIVPQRQRMEWRRLWQDINHVIRLFARGNLIVAVIVGILVGLGVKLIGMDYALLIGIICGIFDLIPYFGPVIGAVPSVLLALTKSPAMALKVALIILIVQQLEGGIISPKLMGDSVGLHPLWIVFAILAGGEIGGFWGMFLAVPIAAILRVVINHIYFRLVSTKV